MVLSIVLVLLQGQMIQFWEDCIQMMLFETLQTTLDSQDVELVDRVIVLNKWHCSCVAFVHLLKSLAKCLIPISGTGTLWCLQKEMATYRHWSVSLWRDPDDVSHCRILSPDKTEWQLISATLCGWRCCFVADQLWLMKCIREETLRRGLLIISISGSYLRIYTVSLGEILACACVKNRIIRSMLRHLSLFQNFWDSLELFVGLDPRVPPQHMPM